MFTHDTKAQKKRKSKRTPSEKNTHKKKRKMKMRVRKESERDGETGLFAPHTKTAKQYKAPKKHPQKYKKKNQERRV